MVVYASERAGLAYILPSATAHVAAAAAAGSVLTYTGFDGADSLAKLNLGYAIDDDALFVMDSLVPPELPYRTLVIASPGCLVRSRPREPAAWLLCDANLHAHSDSGGGADHAACRLPTCG